ncbi:unnamed protein product [Effrenium voratum]|uniref:CobW C-terminal domain-containing protein n=1 Tax=Effrenium voratum TaxID=2562239 RepID=A0AA36ND32_9DINO|nr:unnamed protein product [Effrenium voratum]
MDASSRARKVPVTLLTGFLGAGKTARLNATLKEGKSRIAVIENEIGALGVDGALVANSHAEADGVIELANGCLCCSAEVDLIAAFEALVRRHHLRPLDRIVVETTGLADLGPVISILEDSTDPLSEDLYLDGVVTVVDVCSFQRWASGGEAPVPAWASGFGTAQAEAQGAAPGRLAALRSFWRQVAFADQILLSKEDLAPEADVVAQLRAANPLAEILSAAAAAPLPPPRNARRLPEGLELRPPGAHLDGVTCITLQMPIGSLALEERLARLCRQLLTEVSDLSGEVWRIKGIVSIQGRGLCLLQGAGDQVSIEPWSDSVKAPFLVFIGTELKREALEALLATACSHAMPVEA